jgi:hypothetical protein
MKGSGVPREDIFIVSKTGPGGLAWPLGYNETLQQAREIVANYSTPYVVSPSVPYQGRKGSNPLARHPACAQ